jgi:L-amino acid N-acyltransferase YncA
MHLPPEPNPRGRRRVLGRIALPNEGSVALHEKLGFERIGIFERVGWKFDRWVDAGYWGLTYE